MKGRPFIMREGRAKQRLGRLIISLGGVGRRQKRRQSGIEKREHERQRESWTCSGAPNLRRPGFAMFAKVHGRVWSRSPRRSVAGRVIEGRSAGGHEVFCLPPGGGGGGGGGE
ncbi:hypothetical protein IF1G_03336 [Cordyceps javanica]|uniref:Uncharacterized protein n=1 Tax=Cordyceps javanica TaxID=43265 RepID=A0A545V7A0_9HYPO|nr:hypothetical protein IF1G_03336 [Cordyceps javanica]